MGVGVEELLDLGLDFIMSGVTCRILGEPGHFEVLGKGRSALITASYRDENEHLTPRVPCRSSRTRDSCTATRHMEARFLNFVVVSSEYLSRKALRGGEKGDFDDPEGFPVRKLASSQNPATPKRTTAGKWHRDIRRFEIARTTESLDSSWT